MMSGIKMGKRNKVKPGEILFTPTDNRLMESAPFANNLTNLPDWFRTISKQGAALRRCAGTVDLLAAGVTLPMWTNYRFRPDGNGAWETGADDFYPSAVTGGQPTSIGQASGFNYHSTGECPMTSVRKMETGQYPKLINPWRMETAPGWSTLLIPCYWEPSEDYTVVPAIVHTDYYHSMNVVLNLTGDRAFGIKYNTPIAQLIPFKRDSDFTKVLFNDESDFKYYASTGFGSGFISPKETGAAYRRERTKVDSRLAEDSKHKWWSRDKKK
jgi:hypothetical protein